MMKFSVLTSAPTFNRNTTLSAYSPYVAEMEIWFKYVDKAIIASPSHYPQKVFTQNFSDHSIEFCSLPYIHFSTIRGILSAFISLPLLCWKILKVMESADHIHLRCPGNIGLIACVLQVFFPKKKKTAKYAGNWDPVAKQPWSYKLQKWILSNTFLTRNARVLVYGKWRHQTKNVKSFFTASISENQKGLFLKKQVTPYKFLFVGNLVAGKKPMVALQIVKMLNEKKISAELHFYGDGKIKKFLQEAAKSKNYIHFHGNQPLKVLKEAYKEAHFIVLASNSEGWPKAVAEGMFFGCVPIATSVSCVPWMLNYGSRGILAPPAPKKENKAREWLQTIINDVEELIKNPEEMRRMSIEAQEWSQQYTIERFEIEIKNLLNSGNNS